MDNLDSLLSIVFDMHGVGFPVNTQPDSDFAPALLLMQPAGVLYLAAKVQNNLE
jgi:hypothetical protein